MEVRIRKPDDFHVHLREGRLLSIVLPHTTRSFARALVMPSRPHRIIQKVAPGPPSDTASATPPMLPRPTVAERAVASAWKWLTSPASAGLS